MTLRTQLLPALALVTLLATGPALADRVGPPIVGTWYVALDAEPFGLPPGLVLPALGIFHLGGNFQIVDGGDFGGPPFLTVDTAQSGSWRLRSGQVEAVSLFLRGDAITGDVIEWQRVEFRLVPDGGDRWVGTVNVFSLACNQPAPFPVFGCADPIASAASFAPLPPFDIPITFQRLRPDLTP